MNKNVLVALTGWLTNHVATLKAQLRRLDGRRQRRTQVRTVQPQHRLGEEETAELAAMYQAGATIRQIAERFGIHRTTVMEVRDRLGLRRRQRGLTPDQLEEASRMYGDGSSLAQLGEHLGVDAETVRLRLRELGVSLRPRPGWSG